MTTKLNTQHAKARKLRAEAALTSAFCSASSVIETCLTTLNTANKNRFLLALHAQIGEQLDALAADNDQ